MIVLLADAIVEPLTMVIKIGDTPITHLTVLAGVRDMGITLTAEKLTLYSQVMVYGDACLKQDEITSFVFAPYV